LNKINTEICGYYSESSG